MSDGDVSVAILNLGCITQDWRVLVNGQSVPVVLGYADPDDYRTNPFYMGVIAGRMANRTSGAAFVLGGNRVRLTANEPPHHLHGGAEGLHSQIWDMEPDGTRAVQLRHVSPHGAEGYPGQVAFTVTISLMGDTLRYDMCAECDCPTPVNLAQHSYYNLIGGGTIVDHRICVPADHITPTDAALIPNGNRLAVDGLPVDLRRSKTLAQVDPEQSGLDLNYVLRDHAAVSLTAPNGLTLTLNTDQPCLQLFTTPELSNAAPPLAGQDHVPFGGLCLEPQQYPNNLNTASFPTSVITPDTPYRQRLEVRIAQDAA